MKKEEKNMETTLQRLKLISKKMDDIGNNIRYTGRVLRMEREERLILGLAGDDAIRHYNQWMRRYGLEHLTIE